MNTTLTGSELITKVNQMRSNNATATEIAIACGYVKENGKAKYTEFYTELLNAKGITSETDEDVNVSDEYRGLADSLLENYSYNAVNEFIELYGEENLKYFEDSYMGCYTSCAAFAEDIFESQTNNLPYFIEIDWEKTWQNISDEYDACITGHQEVHIYMNQF